MTMFLVGFGIGSAWLLVAAVAWAVVTMRGWK